MGIEEEFHAKGTKNILNNIIPENSPNLSKEMAQNQIQKALEHQIRQKNLPCHVIISIKYTEQRK